MILKHFYTSLMLFWLINYVHLFDFDLYTCINRIDFISCIYDTHLDLDICLKIYKRCKVQNFYNVL